MNSDTLDFFSVAKSKVDAQIVLREITPSAVNFIGLGHSSGDDCDSGVEGQSIACGSVEFEAHPVATGDAAIAKNHRSPVNIGHDYIHIAVVEKIADRQTAGDTVQLQGRTCQVARVAECSVFLIKVRSEERRGGQEC